MVFASAYFSSVYHKTAAFSPILLARRLASFYFNLVEENDPTLAGSFMGSSAVLRKKKANRGGIHRGILGKIEGLPYRISHCKGFYALDFFHTAEEEGELYILFIFDYL